MSLRTSRVAMATRHGQMRLRRAPRSVITATRYRSHSPILVYQMGKVGSTAILKALVDQGFRVPVEHVHLLADLDAIEDGVQRSYADPSSTLEQLDHARQVREAVDRQPNVSWNVITMVRDPVARNVSAFFESLHEHLPRPDSAALSMKSLGEAFLTRFDHSAPLEWFQRQLAPVFDVDVFGSTFPHSAGFQILAGPRSRTLVIRYENLNDCVGEALKDFLGVSVKRLPAANSSASKWYGALQRRFTAEFEFPDSYLSAMYDSEYATHFYTSAEISGFRRRYRRGPSR